MAFKRTHLNGVRIIAGTTARNLTIISFVMSIFYANKLIFAYLFDTLNFVMIKMNFVITKLK